MRAAGVRAGAVRGGLAHARKPGRAGGTVVLAPNGEGLWFAPARDLAEVERCAPPGGTIPFVTLALP